MTILGQSLSAWMGEDPADGFRTYSWVKPSRWILFVQHSRQSKGTFWRDIVWEKSLGSGDAKRFGLAANASSLASCCQSAGSTVSQSRGEVAHFSHLMEGATILTEGGSGDGPEKFAKGQNDTGRSSISPRETKTSLAAEVARPRVADERLKPLDYCHGIQHRMRAVRAHAPG